MNLEQAVKDFREQFEGKLSEAELAAAIAQIEKAEAAEKVGVRILRPRCCGLAGLLSAI